MITEHKGLCIRITSRTAAPPRFFSELKGKTLRTEDSDLMASNFIPSYEEKYPSLSSVLKNKFTSVVANGI
jgi:hypothetical protein